MSVDEIISEIGKDIPFYEMSGGGVTLSGGEPFSQDPDLKELLYEIKAKGIHVSVETSLHVPWETLEEYIDLVDVFLADLKHLDNEKFAKFTGGNAGLVTANFIKLDKSGKHIVVRIPVIPPLIFPNLSFFNNRFCIRIKKYTPKLILFLSIPWPGKSMQCLEKNISLIITETLKKLSSRQYVEYAEGKGT